MPFLSFFLVKFFYNVLNFASVHEPRIFTFWFIIEKNFLLSGFEGNGNPLQYSCLENPMDRGAWRTTVNGVAKELDTTERLTLVLINPVLSCFFKR